MTLAGLTPKKRKELQKNMVSDLMAMCQRNDQQTADAVQKLADSLKKVAGRPSDKPKPSFQ